VEAFALAGVYMCSKYCVLFDLPLVAAALLCSDWMDLQALSKLDQACTSKTYRPVLLNIFSCEGFKVKNYNVSVENSNHVLLLKWLSERNLAFETLTVQGEFLRKNSVAIKCLHRGTCRQLKQLYVARLKASLVHELLSVSPLLRSIDIDFEGCNQNIKAKTNRLCPLLTELCIRGTQRTISGDILSVLYASKLKALLLSNCPNIGKDFAAQLTTANAGATLRTLHISTMGQLTDSRLARILRACGLGLRHLHIGECKQLTGETFANIATYCYHITELEFWKEMSHDSPRSIIPSAGLAADAGIQQIALACTQLAELRLYNLQDITDLSLRAVLQNITTLTALRVENCHSILGEGTIVPHYSGAPSALTELQFRGCQRLRGVMNVCQICPSLQVLVIMSCNALSYTACTHVFKHGTNLTALTMTNAYSVYGNDLDTIPAGNLPKLRYLNIEGCSEFTDDGLNGVTLICPNLQRLLLSSCHALTDLAMEAVAAHLLHLEYLSIEGCEQIRQFALLNVLRWCDKLRTLRITWDTSNDLQAPLLLSMAAVISRLPLQALYIQHFRPNAHNIEALTRLLDAHPSLTKVQLLFDSERDDHSEYEHLRTYTKLLQRVYPTRHISCDELEYLDEIYKMPEEYCTIGPN
jgi:F-box and leucine-rich repeat protein GRR1